MEENKEKEEEIKSLKEDDFKKYNILINQVHFYDPDNLINKEKKEDLICPICFNIFKIFFIIIIFFNITFIFTYKIFTFIYMI